MPYFSLIVATINRTEHHLNLIKSLKEQSFKDFEIIIVDQNSHSRLKKQLQSQLSSYNLTYLHVRHSMGLSAARNYGLKNASGQVIAFPDDDCWYQKNTLKKVKAHFDEMPTLQGVTGLVTDPSGDYSAGGFMLKKQCVQITRDNAWMTTNSSGIFLKKAPVNYVGNFDEAIGLGAPRFISGEETDLVLRICELGSPVLYDADVNVFHEAFDGSYDKKERNRRHGYGLGFGYILRKNEYTLSDLAFYSSIHFAKGAFLLLKLQPRRAWSHILQGWGRIQGYFQYPRYSQLYKLSPATGQTERKHFRRRAAIG
ncbi:MAG: glycosyltransferase family 2 protein [Spirochaetales bacterium]|nr:glycosyltransferase family 2 protein [Spirochaetales bacterium]